MLARQQASAPTGGVPLVPVDLVGCVRQGVAEVSAQAQVRHIDLGLCLAESGQINGQPDALGMLLRNLLDNALKYTPESGSVDVSVQRDGANLVLTVDDSGPGIEEADRERVLDRFYRVQGAAGNGSGLGLAIVHAIAQSHGAILSLSRAEKLGGLRVQLRFPALG
jgi:two-component system, OmpR family, sensor kinase